MSETFDYIIVGAGSAGCVVANRLSALPDVTVLLLEAGPEPRSLWIGMPAGLSKLLRNPHYSWLDSAEAASDVAHRRVFWPHGRTLGGSSAINGLVYSRGAPHDYDAWAALGNDGWAWADLLPHFEAFERRRDIDAHCRAGELSVSNVAIDHPGIRAFVAAGQSLGLPLDETPDRSRRACVGRALTTTLDGRRHSAADAFLTPVRSRRNLTVRTGSPVRRVLLDGRRAIGVEYGSTASARSVSCRCEVILCGGAVNSPHLLMLSGIGPATPLRDHGISVVRDLPGVGANLQDHGLLNCTAWVEPALSLNSELRGLRLLQNGLRWLLTQRGPVSVGASQAYAFVRSAPHLATPDLQINFRPFTVGSIGAGKVRVDARCGVTLATALLHPRSRGHVALKSARPEVRPAIHCNPLQAPQDLAAHIAGLRWMRRMLQTPPLAMHVRGESSPGAAVGDDDEQITAYVRNTVTSMAHPVGTCSMGMGQKAVVDPQLRVHGIEGLRVVDASVMPLIPSGNTNGPCMLIGARGAELIIGRQARTPPDFSYVEHRGLEAHQEQAT